MGSGLQSDFSKERCFTSVSQTLTVKDELFKQRNISAAGPEETQKLNQQQHI